MTAWETFQLILGLGPNLLLPALGSLAFTVSGVVWVWLIYLASKEGAGR